MSAMWQVARKNLEVFVPLLWGPSVVMPSEEFMVEGDLRQAEVILDTRPA